jgi:diguanylate cyclase (GGDEF)-like protein/PAS domain S-box-containing protein
VDNRPSAASTAFELLRRAGSHPIVREFPEGAIIVFDQDLRYLCAGGHGLASVGLTRETIEGRTIEQVFPPEIVSRLERPYREALSGREATLEIEFDGRIYFHRIAPLSDGEGGIIAGIGFAFEITESKRAQQELRASEERLREERRRLRDAEAIGHSGSWEWDMTTDVITWSDGLYALHGLDPATIEGGYEQAASGVHPDDREAVDAAMETCRRDGKVRFRYRAARAGDGEMRWFDSYAAAVYEDGEIVRMVGSVADVTSVVEAELQLSHDALHDSLTGLPNRALLLDRLTAALARAEEDGGELAVLFCDLDGFKRVNDTAGHAAGDAVLVETANRLRGAIRDGDTVARVGGDEFVLFIQPWNRELAVRDGSFAVEGDRSLALQVADRVVRALRSPIRVNDVDHRVSVSIGISYVSPRLEASGSILTAGDLLERADAAMYRAKRRGKDRFEVFTGEAGREPVFR